MGGEIFVFILAGFGACTFLFLACRSLVPVARPYAFPTFVFASAVGVFEVFTSSSVKDFWIFFLWFFLVAIVFGAHASAIRWFRERRT